MTEDDVSLESTAVEIVPLPLCDDEDETVPRAEAPVDVDPGDDDVEGHGGWDFDKT